MNTSDNESFVNKIASIENTMYVSSCVRTCDK